MIKIGIDLSTTKTGIVVVRNANRNIDRVLVDNTNIKNIQNVYTNFKLALKSLVEQIRVGPNTEIMVGIEISNYKNPKLTQKFSMYAGLIIAILNDLGINNVKWFNSNQWQYLIGCKVSDERDVRKQKARKFVAQFHKCNDWEQDEIDAYCIAHCLEELYSTEQSELITKRNKALKEKQISSQLKLERMVNTRLMEINRLDKVKNAKRIESIKKEIEELGYDLEKRRWK